MTVENIKIIEGPEPTFIPVEDNPLNGIHEGPVLVNVEQTQLRIYNPVELVERCFRAWRKKETISLEYISGLTGLKEEVPIIAAHYEETDEGDILTLWVVRPSDESTFEPDNANYENDEDDEENYI